MPDCEAVADLDFLAIFAADAEEGTNYALLVGVTAQGVVEDGKYSLFLVVSMTDRSIQGATYLRLHYNVQRGCCWLRSNCRWTQGPGKMEEGVGINHVGLCV